MVAIDWLLQAGFRIRGQDVAVAVDPYLSDLCTDVYGLQRAVEAPLTAGALEVDAVCVSHWHEDHLDLPTVLTALHAGSVIIAPPSCLARVRGVLSRDTSVDLGLLRDIGPGEAVELRGATITAVPARHAVPGYLTEDAVGYLVDLDGVRIYHSGDTDYDRSLLAAGAAPLDVALVCINGTGGNMNAVEAAALTAQLRPRIAVPMHVGLWTPDGYGPDANLDPAVFVDHCAALVPQTSVVVPSTDTALEVAPADG